MSWDLKLWELGWLQGGTGRAHSICPWQEQPWDGCAEPGVTSKQKHSQGKELAQVGGFTPALREGKPNSSWSSLDGREKKLGNNMGMVTEN